MSIASFTILLLFCTVFSPYLDASPNISYCTLCLHANVRSIQLSDAWLGSFAQFTQPVVDPAVQAAVKCSHPSCLLSPSSEIGSSSRIRVARVTAGMAESNGSGLQSPAGWLPRTWISSGTLRSVIEYGLPLPFLSSRYDEMICPRQLHFDPKIVADLRPSADGSAVHTSLVAGGG